ncbi:MAG: ATP-grasp domain-containing protein [Cryobacterium sp.]|nr:ATP-grasp domain-containing protein [Oligoflexia bacterium]
MVRPVIIVNPLSSGIELAPAFRARGIPAIAVTLNYDEFPEFGSKIRTSDFLQIVSAQPDLEKIIGALDPLAIIPGTEEAIPLAERLTARFTPQFANDPIKSLHRSHKSFMQMALTEAGVPSLKTLHSASESEVEIWIRENHLHDFPLILKPPTSSGSDKVFHIEPNGNWKGAFTRILNEPMVSGKRSETVVIQEQAIGTEFAVGTVSSDGRHSLAHLMKYNKTSIGDRKTVFDHVEFIPFDDNVLGGIFDYTKRALDALGIRWGAAHTEIMLTKDGPRLIESSPRMIGGPVNGFARAATGSCQADKLVEIYVDGDVSMKEYVLKKSVVPVFLRSPAQGSLTNAEVFDESNQLSTLLSKHLWFKNGDRVPQTIDYLTSIGIIALAGERDLIFSDYEKIRAMESKLVIR